MSGAQDGWVALEDASSAFERPSWAIRSLIEQGKLERKVEDGRVYVRAPQSAVPEPAPQPPAHVAESLDALVAELESLADSDALVPSFDTAPLAISVKQENAPIADPRDSALFRELAADLADLAHATRARDQLLARAAQALREAAARPVEPRPRSAPWALAGVLALVAAIAFVTARVESASADAVRDEAEIALRRATLLESHAARERKETAALAAAFVPASIAAGTSSSLPAGFAK